MSDALVPLLAAALDARAELLPRLHAEQTDAYRLFHGSVEGHPGLTIDRERHEVRHDGKPLELTPTEFKLLCTLAAEPGRVFSRDDDDLQIPAFLRRQAN